MRTLACLLAAAAVVAAQDSGGGGTEGQESPEYRNPDLKLRFRGVYGWEKKAAEGSGAWTRLVTYTFSQFGAEVVLYVRDNPHETFADMREAMKQEFSGDGYRDAQFREAEMRGGLELPAFEVEALRTVENEEGKKREFVVMARTYFGKNRLFRVHCSVRRARAKRVRDLLQSAMAGLEVTAQEEKVVRGQLFQSNRGQYTCVIPEGFIPVLPARPRYDMRFAPRRGGVTVVVYGYVFEGNSIDHVDELVDFYGQDFKIGKEEAKVMGGTGFTGTVKRRGNLTRVTGLVARNRVWRVHTIGPEDKVEEIDRVHQKFLEGFRPKT